MPLIMEIFLFQTPPKLKKEQERNIALMEKLREEKKKQQEHTVRVQHRLVTVSNK